MYLWLQLRQLLHSVKVRASTKNSAQCYKTNFSSDFSGWERDQCNQTLSPCGWGLGISLKVEVQTCVYCACVVHMQNAFYHSVLIMAAFEVLSESLSIRHLVAHNH